MTRRAVFLDRDGTLNRAVVRDGRPYPPAGPDDFEVLAGVAEGLDRLRAAGFVLIVVTNQPDVAKGTLSVATLDAIHARLRAQLSVHDVRVCLHDDSAACRCRKPNPGMLIEAARAHHVDLGGSYMIGDRWRDVEAGRRAGCRTVFIDWKYDETLRSVPDAIVGSFEKAADWILGRAPGQQ